MSELSIPKPPDDASAKGSNDASSRGRSKSRRRGPQASAAPPIPTAEECLQKLAHLPSLVALGVLTPAQSNSMAAAFREILRHHQRAESGTANSGVANLDVLAIAARDPNLINMLAPMLSKQQLDLLMERQEDRSDD
ncbi:MAG: hypothetical protein WD894_22300 [Pirellulales bacterium]